MHPVVGVLLGYFVGSIPAAYIAGRAFRGIDLREHGSGNLGATNVLRVMGAKIGALVLLVDAAKGAAPVLALPPLTGVDPHGWWAVAYGAAAVVGHVRPIFLLWRGGGKGVATAAGMFLALVWLPTLVALVVWISVVLASGYVSLASLVAAVTLPVAVLIASGVRAPAFAVSAVMAAFVFWTHRSNIARLRRGEEHRFGRKKPA
jgi:glycerol-3-phosphate acyltransferase PlsY